MKKLITSLGILSLLAVGAVFQYSNQQAPTNNEDVYTSISALEILQMENEERVEEDVEPLAYNSVLSRAAQAKAEYMAKRGYFAHTSPEGRPFWYWVVKFGYDYFYTGENLAVKFKTSEGVVNAWMKSESHRDNILDAGFRETGIGIATGIYKGIETEFVVQLFGQEMPEVGEK